MTLEIKQTIENILANRKAASHTVKRLKADLETLQLKVKTLEELQRSISEMADKQSATREQVNEINFQPLIERIDSELTSWDNLFRRFERKTINIGVIGLARQGKSTFLQKVAGLSDAEIPSSDRMPCTSVQSNIYHSTEATFGKVYFHSESSFLKDVIAPYYTGLGFSHTPQTLVEFRNSPFPSAPIQPKYPANAEAIYKHLRDDYHAQLDKYSILLQQEKRVKNVTKSEIKEFVSQEYDSKGDPLLFNHLAVEKVEIFCTFPKAGVEQIALVDMPGLGDTRLGDAERMIKALGEDVDFILFVRRPKDSGDLWGQSDVALYDAAFQALKDRLPLKDWSFLLLNADGRNEQACSDLENTRFKKGIHVQKCLKANCTQEEETNQILKEVLLYLTDNLQQLDQKYIGACLNGLTSLTNAVITELEQAKTVLGQFGDDHAKYIKLKEDLLTKLYNKIEELRKKMRHASPQGSPDFKSQVDSAIGKCKQSKGLPDPEELKDRINRYGIDDAYFWSIQRMRPHFLKNFHLLEVSLKEVVEKTKSEVANLLIDIGLGTLIDKEGLDFLEALMEKISPDLSNLKLGFQFICSFEILYKGLIQSVVWQKVSEVFPSDPNVPLKTPENTKNVLGSLDSYHQKAIDNCQKSLYDLASSVTLVQSSMIEEFADHITRAEGIEKEWDIFLGRNRSQIWGELRDLEESRRLKQEWEIQIDDALLDGASN